MFKEKNKSQTKIISWQPMGVPLPPPSKYILKHKSQLLAPFCAQEEHKNARNAKNGRKKQLFFNQPINPSEALVTIVWERPVLRAHDVCLLMCDVPRNA